LFSKRIGGGVVVVVDGLGEHAQKNSFHTRKNIRLLLLLSKMTLESMLKKIFSHKKKYVLLVVVVVVVKENLGERAKKNSFHGRKHFHFTMTTRVRSRLAYLENAHFPICFGFVEIAQDARKRA
jgi:hypothetical protein